MLPIVSTSLAGFPRRAQGFTLIEVMIAVAVVAVLALMAATSFQPWIINGQIRTTASSIADGLRTARAEALKRNKRVTFQLCGVGGLGNGSGTEGTRWVATLYPQTNSFTAPCATTTNILDEESGKGARINGSSATAYDSGSATLLASTVIAREKAVLSSRIKVLDSWAATSGKWSITFDGFGRVIKHPDDTSVNMPANGFRFDVTTTSAPSSDTIRPLAVLVSTAGQIRMCDPGVADSANPRACP